LPRLSVIMPVKNGGRYLSVAIRSTLAAMPRDSELVIANDGSTDNTEEIIEQFSDKRLRSIRSLSSKGVSASLNSLIASTDSELVARMDADDICLPFRFSYQNAVLKDFDCIFSNVIVINEAGVPRRTDMPGHIGHRAIPLHLLMGNNLVHPTMYARRSFLVSLGNYAETAAEDYDLWLRAANANLRMIRSAIPTLLYRKHKLQVSVSGGWLKEDWDPCLDRSYADLAAKHLRMVIRDSTVRLSCTAGNQGLMAKETRIVFNQGIAREIGRLPRSEQILARIRLRKLQGKLLAKV
jgi:glycosyltransferase involved in cell wall biosynthesis